MTAPTTVASATTEAACADRTLVVDIGMDPTPSRAQVFTDLSHYMLNGLSPDKSCTQTGSLTVHCVNLDDRACSLLHQQHNEIDYDTLRDFYQTHHLETVTVRKHDDYIKTTLAELIAVTGYKSWPRTVVAQSNVKRKTRVIYRSPASFPHEISVAETRDCDDGNLNAPILETEVAIRRHGPTRTYEFYAYSPQGQLVDHSHFPAGERPSPTVCVACHYNSAQGTVSRFIPPR
jgi:hypothetical protein